MAKREDFIKNKIKEQGYNLKSFCDKINMPYTTLLSALNKSIGGMSIDNAFKICHGLNISIELLNPYLDTVINKKDDINTMCQRLNSLGKQKADEYITDLLYNPKYTTRADTNVKNNGSDEHF